MNTHSMFSQKNKKISILLVRKGTLSGLMITVRKHVSLTYLSFPRIGDKPIMTEAKADFTC